MEDRDWTVDSQVYPKPSVFIPRVKNSSVGQPEHIKIHKSRAVSTWHIVGRCVQALPAP